ncbi:MAG: ubiquinone/menaquinone biosynthesis methyltransferase [Gemmatimonadaceae bacterium]|nr:ubiquinone/menaquinone biosynthesis methyltransferase [Gemmatimonadaceae bacterium]
MTPPTRLGDLDVEAYLADPSKKQAFVTPMFDVIAPRYDAFTRLFSFGMDASWKREALVAAVSAIDAARESRGELSGAVTVLDLASGTGDLAVGVARRVPGAQVTALDASLQMIVSARARLHTRDADVATRVQTTVGDMCALPVPDASQDVVTAGYGVRNVSDRLRAIAEMARVLRPGGTVVLLDFYRPEFALWRGLVLWYLSLAGNAVGWWWHRDPIVYGYIARSIDHFVSWQRFSRELETAGFRVVSVKRYLFGAVVRHEAIRLPRA